MIPRRPMPAPLAAAQFLNAALAAGVAPQAVAPTAHPNAQHKEH